MKCYDKKVKAKIKRRYFKILHYTWKNEKKDCFKSLSKYKMNSYLKNRIIQRISYEESSKMQSKISTDNFDKNRNLMSGKP